MSSRVAPASALERNWWLRAAAVLVAPSAVFVSLRDDDVDDREARQEPVTALVGLAGIASVLATPVARHLLNDPSVSLVVIPVWAFLGGAIYAVALYWLGGGLLFAASRRLGSLGSWCRSRHLLGLAAAPLALSMLTLWPVRLAVYGQDLFRTGGDDYGRADAVFGGLFLAFLAWSVYLLVAGVHAVHGWSWARAVGAVALAAVFPALLVIATSV